MYSAQILLTTVVLDCLNSLNIKPGFKFNLKVEIELLIKALNVEFTWSIHVFKTAYGHGKDSEMT